MAKKLPEKRRSVTLRFRCLESESDQWHAAADRAGKTFSTWAREALTAAAQPPTKPKPTRR